MKFIALLLRVAFVLIISRESLLIAQPWRFELGRLTITKTCQSFQLLLLPPIHQTSSRVLVASH